MKNVNVKIEELDAGNNKSKFSQNSAGFWRGEFQINWSDWEKEGLPLVKQVFKDTIDVLSEKNKGKQDK